MAEFVASFITGFERVVEKDLPKRLDSIKILNLFDGLVHFSYAGNSRDLEKILYFNNTFFVLKTFTGKNLSFPSIVGQTCSQKKYFLISKGSFRVRFQNENQFAKVDKNIARRAEDYVLSNSKLTVDRLSPSTEVWFSIRREGFAFAGQLISKREFTEKNLNKGELRPEIAYLISCFAEPQKDDVILEPFAGYGSIPVQLAKKFNFTKLYVSDIDEEKIFAIKEKKQFMNNPDVEICACDAFKLGHLGDASVSLVITDPPWGFYEDIGDIKDFYRRMFDSFRRVIKTGGRLVILSARKDELEAAARSQNLVIEDSLHTLVNGKKASLYKMHFA